MLMMFASCRGGAPVAAGDTTAPTISSRTIDSAGTSLTLAFSEAVTVNNGSGFTVSLSGGAATVSYSSGSGTSSLVYTLSRTVNSGETGTLSYTTVSNGIEDAAGNDLQNISSASITNNSTQSASGTLWVDDDFNYTSIANAISVGEWDSSNTNGPATHDIANVTGPFGETMKAYHATYNSGAGEPDTNLQWTVPGYDANDYATGLTEIYVQLWEYRDNWQFAAEKHIRIFGRKPGGSVNIDLIPGLGDGASTDGVCREFNITGQGDGEDALWFNDSFTWPNNGDDWMLFCYRIRLNTVGNSDGRIEGKIYNTAGTLICDSLANNINIRDNPSAGSNNQTFTISGVRCGGWESGYANAGPPATEHRYITYFKISDYFIGYPGN